MLKVVSIHARRVTGDLNRAHLQPHSVVSIHARRVTGDRDNLCNYRHSDANSRI